MFFPTSCIQPSSAIVQHWHGIFQEGTQWADGPVGVNQCPIIPGESFLYDFTVPDQAGSFWYHSHHGLHPLFLAWIWLMNYQVPNIVMD